MLRKVQYDKGRVGMTKKDSFIRDKKTSQFDNKGRFRPLFSHQPATHKKALNLWILRCAQYDKGKQVGITKKDSFIRDETRLISMTRKDKVQYDKQRAVSPFI